MRRPPGPGTLGTIRRLASSAKRAEGLAALAREHGDLAYLRLGPTGLYLLGHPDLTSSVLVDHSDRFERIPAERNVSRWLVGEALFASEGGFHARQRALIEPIAYDELPRLHAGTAAGFATGMAAAWREGETVDVMRDGERMASLLMVRVLFGADGSKAEAIVTSLQNSIAAGNSIPLAFTTLSHRMPMPGRRRLRRRLAELHELIDEAIEADGSSLEPNTNVLSLLRHAQTADGERMSAEQARDEAIALYRGQGTLAAALAWTWYLLSQHQEVEARVHDEIDTVVGDRAPAYHDFDALRYTLMVVRESLRLYPPVWVIARRALESWAAGDSVIPAGANVLISSWIHHRDPRFWQEPERFDPERFAAGITGPPSCAYMPLGAGVHRCAGMDFLPVEAVMTLAAVGRRWRLRLVRSHRVVAAAALFLSPKGGMPMVAERRSES